MSVIGSQNADPADFADECSLLPVLIGQFTDAVMTYVRASYPTARFEVLYPPDALEAGHELRFLQEYFLAACALRDIIRRFEQEHRDCRELGQHVAIQLNDTHPALAVAELMRILIDERNLEWDEAWSVTQAAIAYTNHTLAPEALEKWPVTLLEAVVPRHLQIIFEINRRVLDRFSLACPGDSGRLRRMSIIEESDPKQVRMAHLAMFGSHAINGVSRIHTEAIQTSLAPDYFQLWPERFHNVTNGISQRRWLLVANPALAGLITATIGDARAKPRWQPRRWRR